MRLLPDPDTVIDSAATGWDHVLGGGVADLTPTPSSIVFEAPQCTVHRYRSRRRPRADRAPVLLVPPLAAPASCFDLHRGCSLAEHLTAMGYPTYLVDYGPIHFHDRALGLEHWVEDVIPQAVRVVSEDADGAPVQTLGWCLGGIMTLLAVAADDDLPVASVAMVASPFDFEQVRLFGPIRQLGKLTGGALVSALYRALGGAPAPLVSRAFQLTAFDRFLTKPLFLASHLHDRETIAHMEAVDAYMARMAAYPGRTFGQLYHAFFRDNSLAGGKIELRKGQEIDLADVRQPVLSVAGSADVLAPEAAVRHVDTLLPAAAEITVETAPGGHLGVLTGRSAKDTTWQYLDAFLGRHDPVRPEGPAVVRNR
jgi:polyhydroxyalkanoate synthase subunit PhaC